MKKTPIAFAILALIAIVGCSSTESTVTKQEEQDFKGKPIPPEMIEKMKNARGGAPSAPAPGAPAPGP